MCSISRLISILLDCKARGMNNDTFITRVRRFQRIVIWCVLDSRGRRHRRRRRRRSRLGRHHRPSPRINQLGDDTHRINHHRFNIFRSDWVVDGLSSVDSTLGPINPVSTGFQLNFSAFHFISSSSSSAAAWVSSESFYK